MHPNHRKLMSSPAYDPLADDYESVQIIKEWLKGRDIATEAKDFDALLSLRQLLIYTFTEYQQKNHGLEAEQIAKGSLVQHIRQLVNYVEPLMKDEIKISPTLWTKYLRPILALDYTRYVTEFMLKKKLDLAKLDTWYFTTIEDFIEND